MSQRVETYDAPILYSLTAVLFNVEIPYYPFEIHPRPVVVTKRKLIPTFKLRSTPLLEKPLDNIIMIAMKNKDHDVKCYIFYTKFNSLMRPILE